MIIVKLTFGDLYGQDQKSLRLLAGDDESQNTCDSYFTVNCLNKLEKDEGEYLFKEITRQLNECIQVVMGKKSGINDYQPPLANVIKKELFGDK